MRPEPELASVSDLDLLEQLCSSENDDAPYKEFVRRFLPGLKDECRRKCLRLGLDRHVGDQIAHECFERVRQYKSFKKDKIRLPNDQKAILAYLCRISARLFTDHHNQEKQKEVEHRTYFDDIRDEARGVIDAKGLKDTRDMAMGLLKKLSPSEQAVMIADLEHKRHQKYLPDDITMELAERLKVKPDTIRKIRQRAIEKLNKAIDEINQA